MVRVGRVLVMMLVIGLACGAASAAEIAKGAKELAFDFSYADTADVGTALNLDAEIGWFLSPANELGIIFSFFDLDVAGSQAGVSGGGYGVLYRWNFRNGTETLVPFVGVNWVWPYGDLGDTQDSVYGFEAGTRIMLGNRASVNVAAVYDKTQQKSGFPDTELWGISAGISIFFGNE